MEANLTWTRRFENKTVTRALNTEQLVRHRPWFEEHRHLRQLTKDLEVISLRAVLPTGSSNGA